MTNKIITRCSFGDCDGRLYAANLCATHYQRVVRPSDKLCDVESCGRRHYAKGFCVKHYKRVSKGKAFDQVWNAIDAEPVTRFWSSVDVGDSEHCWEWKRGRVKTGYGSTWWKGKIIKTHRMAYILTYGEIAVGLLVRHRCDNPPCCNPRHLEIGTAADNSRDKRSRGREARGEQTRVAKLAAKDIPMIRRMVQEGTSYAETAKAFGVCKSTIVSVISGNTWKHVI